MSLSEPTELPVSFLTPLADVHVYEKDEAKFELEISREPKSFRWLKGSQELSNDDKFELLVEGNRHILVVKSARYDDEGKYMFEAEDKRTTGKLIIKGKCRREANNGGKQPVKMLILYFDHKDHHHLCLYVFMSSCV